MADQEELLRESTLLDRDSSFPAAANEKSTIKDHHHHTRHHAFVRAIYAEFMGTLIFLSMIFGSIANCTRLGWDPISTTFAVTAAAGLQLIATIFCFSSLSGSQLNPAITFSLWVCGKISNRKCIAFIAAQFLASIIAVAFLYAAFPGVDQHFLKVVAVNPPSDASWGNIFFTEFFTTFILTFVAFAMAFEEAETTKSSTMALKTVEEDDGLLMYASNPQSKAGFAPFAIGFTLIALIFYGGGSGVCLNPARMLGPAIFANIWDKFYIYWIGEFLGAAGWFVCRVWTSKCTT